MSTLPKTLAASCLVAGSLLLSACSSGPPEGAPAESTENTGSALSLGLASSLPVSGLERALQDWDEDVAEARDAVEGDPPIPPAYQAFATTFDQERASLGITGASVAMLQHGRLAFYHGFGTRGLASPAPVDARTLFRIGSMTKALTATALLGLLHQDRLGVDTPFGAIVPEVSSVDLQGGSLAAVTLRQLLTHQSGIVDYLVIDGPTDDGALSQFLTSPSLAKDLWFMVPPGTFFNYSNPDYYFAGLAVERLAGVPYRVAMQQRVFAPLGMRRTFFLPSDVVADGDFAYGVSTYPDLAAPQDVAPGAYDNAWGRPAGYAFSSVFDYTRFMRFLYEGNAAVLPDRLRQAMQSPQVNTHAYGDIVSYGYGLETATGIPLGAQFYPGKVVTHNGGISGYSCVFLLVPSTGFGIVILTNSDGAGFAKSLQMAIESFSGLGAPTALPAGVGVDPSEFPKYVGTYNDPYQYGAMTVTLAGGTLSIDVPVADAAGIPYTHALIPVSANNFVVVVGGSAVPITFIADATGTFRWLSSRTFVGTRVTGSM